MDGKTVLDTMQTKYKVKSLATLRSGPKVSGEKLIIDSLRLFASSSSVSVKSRPKKLCYLS